MNGLSYGVIRVDTEEKLSVLTVQDVGQVMPGGEKQSVHRHPAPTDTQQEQKCTRSFRLPTVCRAGSFSLMPFGGVLG